jgi:hypothetical protein
MTTECDNCNKECHDMCGETRDVPDKLLENFPAFFCLKCLSRLPKRLYPKIPKNGIPVNVTEENHHGYAFQIYMNKMRKKYPKSRFFARSSATKENACANTKGCGKDNLPTEKTTVTKAKGSDRKKRTPKKKSPGKTRFNPPRSTTKSQRSCKKA